MKISLNWLSDFIEITEKDNEKIKEVITAKSAEIETMEDIGAHLEKIVVGKIEKVMPHPDADKLRLTIVDDGQEKVQVVCGGSNLKEGMKVAFAKLGAVVKWHGTETVKMEKAKIRGQESFGMICAADEIGLEEIFPKKEEKEIADLSNIAAPVGTSLAKALGLDDVVIDVDNHAITNRPDLFSQRGFAREFVACGLAKWKKGKEEVFFNIPENNSPSPISIKIKDPEVCSNLFAVYITGIEVGRSPEWMQKRLTACGIRPISNIVDITNYVMLELGMPTHAFDPDQVKGKDWIMRKSKKGEKVITLDEKEIVLFEGVTVLDDGNELFDLCGIMGGLHSGISPKTDRILIHSPVYNPSLTRRAVRGLSQISDAAIIYEKNIDNELALGGLKRCVELILELCPSANIASEVMHIQNYKPEIRVIRLRNSQVSRLVGADIPAKETKKILEDLGCEVSEKKEGFDVTVPSWRFNDIKMEADLIEEAARIYGYDNIPFEMPKMDISPIPINKHRVMERGIKEKLISFGFSEIYTFAFTGPGLIGKCLMKAEDHIEIANPISSDMSIMRQSLLPRTLETIADNLRYKKQFHLFELSRVYNKKEEESMEHPELIMASAGEDFRSLQGIAEDLGFTLKPMDPKQSSPYQHPGRTASLMIHGQNIGLIYEAHPQVLKNFGIKTSVIVAEVDISKLHEMEIDTLPKYKELPKYPAIQLDISILIKRKDLAEQYSKAIQKTDKTLIKNIELTDEYMGENISADKRSLTYSVTYRSDTETLTDEQVNKIHAQVIANLKKEGAEIRA